MNGSLAKNSRSTLLPTDRSEIATEQRNPASAAFDEMAVDRRVLLMAADHACVVKAVEQASSDLAALITALARRMEGGGRLIYLGAGTSGRLGVLDAAECLPTFQSDPQQVIGIIAGGDASLRQSSEASEDDPAGAQEALDALVLTRDDTVIGLAAGGTTPFVLGGLEIASRSGALTALVTCSTPPQRAPGCDHLIVLNTGPEILTGSTRLKAGSATKLALNIISTCLFTELGKVHSNLMVDLRATNDKLRDRSIRVLRTYAPHLSRTHAAQAIEQAHGDLKCAIIMQLRHLDLAEARKILAAHGGHLRPIIGDGHPA